MKSMLPRTRYDLRFIIESYYLTEDTITSNPRSSLHGHWIHGFDLKWHHTMKIMICSNDHDLIMKTTFTPIDTDSTHLLCCTALWHSKAVDGCLENTQDHIISFLFWSKINCKGKMNTHPHQAEPRAENVYQNTRGRLVGMASKQPINHYDYRTNSAEAKQNKIILFHKKVSMLSWKCIYTVIFRTCSSCTLFVPLNVVTKILLWLPISY